MDETNFEPTFNVTRQEYKRKQLTEHFAKILKHKLTAPVINDEKHLQGSKITYKACNESADNVTANSIWSGYAHPRWPITDCMTWMNRKPDNACSLPSQKDTWLIHGVSPTKFGTMGPFFCNNSQPFDIASLQPLIDQMRQYWMNIEKGTSESSLWRHEWEKHGTCASVLKELSTENKYFGQGLQWLVQYTMSSMLSKSTIEPGSSYHVVDFHNAIKNTIDTNPSIHCVREKNDRGNQYLSEIKICFNKNLELVDCNGVLYEYEAGVEETDEGIITNCDLTQQVQYLSHLPQHLLDKSERESMKTVWRFPWVNLYKLIQIIKWFTL